MRFMGWAMRGAYRRPRPPLHTRLRGLLTLF
jgi:hypothetical protein